jgi:cellulose biosynthesis protein BcsQ
MKTIAFFNNKGGVGKTSLCYHLAVMFSRMGLSVVAADLDPQANLTSMFLDDERLEQLWPEGDHPHTVFGAIQPILRGLGDLEYPGVEEITEQLGLVAGDLNLSIFEDKLSDAWPRCMDRKEADFRVMSSFYRLMVQAAKTREAELVLIDVGPNLGSINRAALISAHYIVIPLAPDLFSLQGLRNLGPALRRWREEWGDRLKKRPSVPLELPPGEMKPIGYVILQHAVRADRPVKAYAKWIRRIPGEYRHSVLGEPPRDFDAVTADPHCLALLKHYRSLMPMAQEARKPMFDLKPADRANGAHVEAVLECHRDFQELARRIAAQCRLPLA